LEEALYFFYSAYVHPVLLSEVLNILSVNNGRQQAADFASKICFRTGAGNMTLNIFGGNRRKKLFL
jgi:hypothetical protein